MSSWSARTRRSMDSMLPARVARAIAVEQDRSEQIIGWFQMGVVTVFALLFAFAPPAAGAMFDAVAWMNDSMLPAPVADVLSFILANPVPWALGLYFVATVVRLIWAYRWRLPAWSLVISIMIDMALLLGLIWSFHIQYGQPPAFYLKAPTLLYVFIFIALRALRSEERYILVAGAAAAIGWSLLVAYAAAFDPNGAPTTHNYVEYMTSPRILWGAEVDKIVSILVVTVVISWSMRKSRMLLLRAVAEGEAARDLKRFFSADVAQRITGADEAIKPGQGELRDAAIVFIDLRGFTALSQSLRPDQVIQIVGEYQMRMVPIIQRFNGTIDKFLGDGIMATFGCARPTAQYAADALTAIDAIMAEAEAWTVERAAQDLPPIKVGAAVATGRVIFGAVGDETRLEYTVIGDAVNLAAKLEKQTKTEMVRALTTADSYKLACEQGFTAVKETRRGVRVGGISKPVDLVVIA